MTVIFSWLQTLSVLSQLHGQLYRCVSPCCVCCPSCFVWVRDDIARSTFTSCQTRQHMPSPEDLCFNHLQIFQTEKCVHYASKHRAMPNCSGTSHIDIMNIRPSWDKGILYNNPIRSDVLIKCGNREIYAHKAILMTASGLFYTAFSSNFAVWPTNWQNFCPRVLTTEVLIQVAEASIYEIDGYEPVIVEIMIRHIYRLPPSEWPSGCALERTMECFAIANEYQVPSFGRLLARHLTNICGSYVECSKTRSDRSKTFGLILDHISALYRDNVIADRSLIESVADMLTTNFCNALIRPEVIELLYVRRTTRPGNTPPSPVSTMFRPVTMSDWSKRDLREHHKSNNLGHVKP